VTTLAADAGGAGALIADLLARASALREDLRAVTARFEDELAALHPRYRESGANLLQYLALRRHDLRDLQKGLASLGLSSLGRTEAHTLATLDSVLHALHALAERPWRGPPGERMIEAYHRGKQLLEDHTADLLGPRPNDRFVRIMVTLPSEAAEDPALVRGLVARGMDCARINCAHDEAVRWRRMAEHVRRAAMELGAPCRILMDLSGPKLRTGALAPGPHVVKVRPARDACGAVVEPARVWLTPADEPAAAPAPAATTLLLPRAWLADLAPGDRIKLRDLRGKRRALAVEAKVGASAWVTADETCYLAPGVELKTKAAHAVVGALPATETSLTLLPGERLILTRDPAPGRPAGPDGPARLACTLPSVFGRVRPGERVWLDDGRLGGVVEEAAADALTVRLDLIPPGGAHLGADKGINLPDSRLELRGLTDKDREDLGAVAELADLVGLSFVNAPEDVAELQDELARRGSRAGIVLKVETQAGFDRLPHLLLRAMRSHPVGVMIARGDLAVECGFERLAEVQEEILCVCEAAQVPVVWATQVLESMARTGRPSRAEVTDAAMSMRAECVMLNKGPFILDTVSALADVIRRMQTHQNKRTPKLRALHLADVLDGPRAGSAAATPPCARTHDIAPAGVTVSALTPPTR
jgi:pyruvate kinase